MCVFSHSLGPRCIRLLVKYPGGGDRCSGGESPAVSWFRRRGCIPMACLMNRFMSSMLMSSS